jgi:DNA-binding NarL/FixJ family response regulator
MPVDVPVVRIAGPDGVFAISLRNLLAAAGLEAHVTVTGVDEAEAPESNDTRDDAVERIRDRWPAPVVHLSESSDVEAVRRAVHDSVMSIVDRLFTTQVVEACVRTAQTRSLEGDAAADSQDDARLGKLTPRELEVLDSLVCGLRNKEIAELLNISPRTVESHRAHIMQKLEAETVAHLVGLAYKSGLCRVRSSPSSRPSPNSERRRHAAE